MPYVLEKSFLSGFTSITGLIAHLILVPINETQNNALCKVEDSSGQGRSQGGKGAIAAPPKYFRLPLAYKQRH